MHILALQAYDGGSHKHFLDGLITHSEHQFTRINLPARKWKWRMRGSALYFAERLRAGDIECDLADIDVIFTTDMTATADLKALLPVSLKSKPIVCYFHENQLTYPLPNESDRDYQYGFTNITSCLAADAVWFNSQYHRQHFLEASQRLLQKMPDYVPPDIVATIESRSQVIPPGLPDDVFQVKRDHSHASPPTVLWNHRWEYDKNPDAFFEVLFDLDRSGVDFRVIIAGETFRQAPPIFEAARERLKDKIIHFGYAADRWAYIHLLAQADVVVSTSIHEFFGLAVLEAIVAGGYALLPNRLSYPELVPEHLHDTYLYDTGGQLRERLADYCRHRPAVHDDLRNSVFKLSWAALAKRFDRAFEQVMTP